MKGWMNKWLNEWLKKMTEIMTDWMHTWSINKSIIILKNRCMNMIEWVNGLFSFYFAIWFSVSGLNILEFKGIRFLDFIL